jgi:hypothetical protein
MKLDPTLKHLGSILRDRAGDITQAPLPRTVVDLLKQADQRMALFDLQGHRTEPNRKMDCGIRPQAPDR